MNRSLPNISAACGSGRSGASPPALRRPPGIHEDRSIIRTSRESCLLEIGVYPRKYAGLDLVHVPFNSAGLAVGSAVGGHTQICFASPSPAAQQVMEGRLRGLAVTSKTRSQALPNLPTTTELGYPDVTGDNWQGLVVPAGTPKQIIAFLHGEIIKIMALPDIRERLAVLGFEPVASTPEEFAQHVNVEFMKWAKVIKASNIKPE